jgi:ATP-dependent exoDNAse (exonuclease V) alpha subunit
MDLSDNLLLIIILGIGALLIGFSGGMIFIRRREKRQSKSNLVISAKPIIGVRPEPTTPKDNNSSAEIKPLNTFPVQQMKIDSVALSTSATLASVTSKDEQISERPKIKESPIRSFSLQEIPSNNIDLASHQNIARSPNESAEDDLGPDPSNPESSYAYELMKGISPLIFVTGKAGTGKSFLLKYFMQRTSKRIVLLAPTGIAALNINGQTIHSFFHFPPRIIDEDDIHPVRNQDIYRQLDAIIIDEVSMVNANLIDAIDHFMRLNGKHSGQPFGGVQMIFIGDLFQLPPIVSDDAARQYFNFHYLSPFFFAAKAFIGCSMHIVELNQNYRQRDTTFIELLNAVRVNQLNDVQQSLLNSRFHPNFIPPRDQFFVTLAATNQQANQINNRMLSSLHQPQFTYVASIEGEFSPTPTDIELQIKVGAQVMFLKNDTDKRWVNGTIGRIVELEENYIGVEVISNGEPDTHQVEKVVWEKLKYRFDPFNGKIKSDIVGRFTQYPLKLAWAITIHKSQGQTHDSIIIDLTGGTFEHGQVYVALSRCRSLEGIILKTQIWKSDILTVDRYVLEFSKRTKHIRELVM